MPKFSFETKTGVKLTTCISESMENAWVWIAKTKQLTLDQVKELYNIKKISNDD